MKILLVCRKLPLLFLIIFLPLLMAMGSSGNSSPDKLPVPAKKFTAIFVDQMDIVTEARDISIEGSTYLEGKKGEGVFTISFENIKYITFLTQDGKLTGGVYLRDGNSLQLTLNKNKKVFGRTPYGTFQISLGELKKLTFTGQGKSLASP